MHKTSPFVLGRIIDFRPTINELKVFRGDEEHRDEATKLNKQITAFKNKQKKFEDDPIIGQAYNALFKNAMPLTPYPAAERCLGLEPQGSLMKIEDGYAVLAFDFGVRPAEEYCLFQMKEMLVDREMRMLEKAASAEPGVKQALKNDVTNTLIR